MAPRQVLLVDDDPTLSRVVGRILRARGADLRQAGSVKEALGAIEQSRPDVLLLDIDLPDRTGWDLLRELRERGIAIRTVVLSAVRVTPDRLSEFGHPAYLPKPFPVEALVRHALGDSDPEVDTQGG